METFISRSAIKKNEETIDVYICDFCIMTFHTRAERNVHVMVHFEKKPCSDCNKILIRIADDWYEIHGDGNCSQIKCESESDFTTAEKFEEIIIKSEDVYPVVTDELNYADSDGEITESNKLNANVDASPALHACTNSKPSDEEVSVETQTENEPYIDSRQQPKEKKRKLKNDDLESISMCRRPKRTNKKPLRVQCQICHEFFSKGQLLAHLQAKHVPKIEIPKQCATCGRSFSSVGNLNSHKRIHADTREFVCSYCGRDFVSFGHLKEHINSHTGEKPYNCDVCNKSFGRATLLHFHKRIHTGDKRYKCPIDGCERAYTYLIDLKRHKFGVHRIYTKKHVCRICSKVYSENKLLKKHLESHSANLQNKNVECSIDLTIQLVKNQCKITMENVAKKDLVGIAYRFLIPEQQHKHLAFISVKDALKKELKAVEERVPEGVAYTVTLNSASPAPVLHIETIFTQSLQPYPTQITQSDRQFVRFIWSDHHLDAITFFNYQRTRRLCRPSSSQRLEEEE